jgi:hypothetical protein
MVAPMESYCIIPKNLTGICGFLTSEANLTNCKNKK